MATKKLRFAGYCRTSGERQRNNTSIATQKEDVASYADRNDWTFTRYYVDECKSGGKIAGRDAFQQMLKDAAAGKFDVLVVWDITRFARDGLDILNAAKALKEQHGVPVICTKGRFDNRDVNNTLANFVNAGVSEAERLSILQRTFAGRVRTAKAGHLAVGTRPVGRLYDKKTKQWSIDKEVQQKYQTILKRCLKGESLQKLAKEYGLNHSNLHENLMRNCGDVWNQKLESKILGVSVVVPTPVPRLLDEKSLAAFRAKVEANKTYKHGAPKNKYLLNRMVFCAECGHAMTGGIKQNGTLVYRHQVNDGAGECPVRPRPYIKASVLEEDVLRKLFDTFGNPQAVRKAIAAATPNLERQGEYLERLAQLEGELAKVATARDRILTLIENDNITNEQAARKLGDLKAKETTYRTEWDSLREAMANLPTPEAIKAVSVRFAGKHVRLSSAKLTARKETLNSDYSVMTWEDKRALVEQVFAGKTVDGKRMGVYITAVPADAKKRRKRWVFEVRGIVDDGGVTGYGGTTPSTTTRTKSPITPATRHW